jgi:hypothetical protein
VSIRNSKIQGHLESREAAVLAVCGSELGGKVSVSGTSGFVLLGDPGDDDCEVNTVLGMATVTGNRGGVEMVGNSFRGGLTVEGNTGNGPLPEHAGTEIQANQITGKLSCSSNTPAPTNDGQPNTSGTRSGQCDSPTF